MELDVQRVREDFPVTKYCIYLNTGFFGPCARPVTEAVKSYLEECCIKGMGSYEVFAKALAEREHARKELAKLLNARPDEIALTSRATEGINTVVKGLKWEKGDKVIINDLEYPPAMMLWKYLEEKLGVKIVTIKSDENGFVDPANVEKAIDERTKLISMCHVTYDTGIILQAKEIGKIAKEHSVLYLLDGAQAVGAIKVDVKDLNCHFYALAGQKFLGAGEGTGALYFEKEEGEKLIPLIISGSYTSEFVPGLTKVEAAEVFSPEGRLLAPYKFETASLNYPGIIGLAAATEYLNKIGIGNVEKRIRKLATMALERLEKIPDLRFIGTTDPHKRFFASFEIKNVPNPTITNFLEKERKIITRALKKCVRACFHYMNTEEEVEELAFALKQMPRHT